MKVSELIDELKEVDQDVVTYILEDGEAYLVDLSIIVEDIHINNDYVFICGGDSCYYCERNSESPQNYKKVKGLRID